MKMVKMVKVAAAVLLAASMVLAGCSSTNAGASAESKTDKALANAETETAGKVEIIGWKNRDLGFGLKDAMPPWLKAYVGSGDTSAIEALPEYKGMSCFVPEEMGADLKFITVWAQSYNVQNQIGGFLCTGIADTLQAAQSGSSQSSATGSKSADASTSGQVAQNIANRLGTKVNAIVQGMQRKGDFWTETRSYDPSDKTKYQDSYHYYALYTVPTATLQEQAAKFVKANEDQIAGLAGMTAADISKISDEQFKWAQNKFSPDSQDAAAKTASTEAAKTALAQ
jgi:hypothetical protein